MGRVERLTRRLKTFDPALYCAEDKEGKLCVYRNSTRTEAYWIEPKLLGLEGESPVLMNITRPTPFYIFALTHDFSLRGRSVEWSWDLIKRQLQKHDAWNQDVMSRIEEQEVKSEEASLRKMKNDAEAFASDTYSLFKRQFSDINTANLAKIDRRKLDEEKHGNN